MTPTFRLKISQDGIAELIFDLAGEKVNTFSLVELEELESKLDQLHNDPSVKVLKLMSGKNDSFIAGANLKSISSTFDDRAAAEKLIKTGHRVFNKLQNLPFPTVAIIHGICVGGGLECALSCTYRLVSDHPKTKLGLPEVTLGIFPGWGGTQRLPRLIGLTEGLSMILPGKIIPAIKAWKIHLADAIVAWEFLDVKANEFVSQILSKEGKTKILKRRDEKSFMNRLLESNPIGRSIIYWKAKKDTLEKTKGHYPAPLLALDVIKKTYPLPLEKGLQGEIDGFLANIPDGFYLARYLIDIFFSQEAVKKDPGFTQVVPPQEVHSAAVIGAGTMGAEISWLLADHKIFTRLKDISWEYVGKGIAAANALFKKGLKNKKIKQFEYERHFDLISGTVDYSGFQRSDLILEAATENLELKKKIFQEVEDVVKHDAVIASNTSSLTIAEMSDGMRHPERFVGMHFFNPVSKMPLVEVVPGKKTTPQAIANTVELCKNLGKTPIIVGDCPGFVVNRILIPGINEVMLMLEEGYSMDLLEKEFVDFGMPMKPFILADEIGNDVTYKVAKSLEKGYGERMRPAKIFQLMMDKELYGRKNGKGFYLYNGTKVTRNPEIKQLLENIGRTQTDNPKEEILPRFLYSMINEAARCLEEKVISRADYLDLCLILGSGFPPFRGGLLRYADKVGVPNVVQALQRLESKGMRFKPCSLLLQTQHFY